MVYCYSVIYVLLQVHLTLATNSHNLFYCFSNRLECDARNLVPPTPLPTTDFPTRAPFFGPTKIPTEMPIEPPDPLPFPSIDPKGEIFMLFVCVQECANSFYRSVSILSQPVCHLHIMVQYK